MSFVVGILCISCQCKACQTHQAIYIWCAIVRTADLPTIFPCKKAFHIECASCASNFLHCRLFAQSKYASHEDHSDQGKPSLILRRALPWRTSRKRSFHRDRKALRCPSRRNVENRHRTPPWLLREHTVSWAPCTVSRSATMPNILSNILAALMHTQHLSANLYYCFCFDKLSQSCYQYMNPLGYQWLWMLDSFILCIFIGGRIKRRFFMTSRQRKTEQKNYLSILLLHLCIFLF